MSSQRRCGGCGRRLTGRQRYCDAGCARDHGRRRAAELADEARADLDLTTSGYPRLAEHPGTCPLCGRFIRAGRSRIVALTEPTFPIVPLLDENGDPKRRRRRAWCHADCVARLERTAAKGPLHDDER